MSSFEIDTNAASARPQGSLSPLYGAGIVLAAITGGIHLWLGVTAFKPPLIVAGVGFAVGIAAVVLDVHRQEMVGLGIPFTAVQIPLYFVAHAYLAPSAPDFAAIGLADKAVQGALIAVLVVLYRRE